MVRNQPKGNVYQKQQEEVRATMDDLYAMLGRAVKNGIDEVGGRERFLSYLGEKAGELSGYEKRYGTLKLGKDSYQEVRKIITQIQRIEKSVQNKNEPAWLKLAKSIYTRYEKRKGD